MSDEEFDDFVIPDVEQDSTQDDFYQILGVGRSASNEEITNAFRHLSKIYHPDKHSSKGDKAQVNDAEKLFAKIKHAYEVLIDANKRAIYDITGEKGLELEAPDASNAVIPRYRTAQEIREDFERQLREREERNIERKTNPKGNMTVSVNATEIFNRYEDEYFQPALVEITAFHLQQSVETPLTDTDTFVLHGSVSAENGRGRGAIYGGFKKTLGQQSWAAIDVGGGMGGVEVDAKAGTQFGKYYWASVQAAVGGSSRSVQFQLNNQLTTNSVGSIVWRMGNALHGLQCSYVHEASPRRILISLHLGIPHSFGLISYTHKSETRGEKYKTAVKAGTFGAFFEYGVEKKISSISTIGATVMIGIPVGVSLKMRVHRNNQSYVFPIQLAEEIIPAPIFYATITPFLAYYITKKLFLEPYEKEKTRKEKEKLKELYKQKLEEKRAEAEAAINLMQETYYRIERDETAKSGLIITEAFFGVISPERKLSSEIICVTIPLQCLVKNSKLVVPAGSKSQLPGFYDPAPGEDKSLLVRYLFNGEQHESFNRETDVMKLPKMSHRVEPL